MKIEFIYNGKAQVIDNVSIGGSIKIEYTKTDGEKMVYYLKITSKETLLVNK